MHRPIPSVLTSLSLCLAVGLASAAGASASDPSAWARVLERFVDDEGRVDYRGLAEDRADLDLVLDRLATTGPRSTPERFPDRASRLAYLVDAYNAFVFQGVLELGPDVGTVWGLTGTGFHFFGVRSFRLDGASITLKKLEDEWIRAEFGDPRIHAALVCASAGCPRLPREPFEGDDLDARLDAAFREMALDPLHVRVDREAGVLWLSKIFEWFAADFAAVDPKGREGIDAVLAALDAARGPGNELPRDLEVRFPAYDKKLNRQPRPP